MKTDNHVHYDVERLRAISIRAVASQFGTVKRSGSTCTTLCPWHEDHHPSLSLVEGTNKNYCHCFSCDRGGDVINYVMAAMGTDFCGACEWLSNQYGIPTTNGTSYVPPPRPKPVVEVIEPPSDYIPTEMAEQLVSVENSLCHCLMRWFHPEAVKWYTEEYRIGAYSLNGRDDCTVFPSIDYEGHVCNLKVQCYDTDPQSPRFAHSEKGICYWLASMWQKEGRLPSQGHYTAHCLFGEHLLFLYPARTVVLVESPKNALVGVLEHPQLLWLATGSKHMLKRRFLEPLRGRDVIVIPDCDAVDLWEQSLSSMHDITHFSVSDFCRRMAPADKPKYDIADYIIDQHQKGV